MHVRRLVVLATTVACLSSCNDAASPSMEVTPLQEAVSQRDYLRVEQLLLDGSDPNEDVGSGTAMELVTVRNDLVLLELLLQHGGRADAVSADGATLLSLLAFDRQALERDGGKQEFAALLVANGANVCVRAVDQAYDGWPLSEVALDQGELELADYYADLEMSCSDDSASVRAG